MVLNVHVSSSQVSQSNVAGGQDKHQEVKQLQSLLEKTRADLAAEKAAVAISNKEAAKLRVLLKVGLIECAMLMVDLL